MNKVDGCSFDKLVVRAKAVCENPRFVAIALTSGSPTMAGKRAVKAGLDETSIKGIVDLARVFRGFPERIMELWKEKTMSGKYDFKTTMVNDWSVKMDFDVVMDYFAFLAATVEWICGAGQELLKKEEATYREWDDLLEHSFWLLRDLHGCKPIDAFFVMVVDRGIDWLTAFAKSGTDQRLADGWYQSIMYQLHPGARAGVNGEVCSVDKSKALLKKLVPYAQLMKNEYLIKSIAGSLYPNDSDSQQMFITNHKNW